MALRKVLQIVSWLALATTLWPAFAFFHGSLDLPAVKRWLLLATVVWFATAWAGTPSKPR